MIKILKLLSRLRAQKIDLWLDGEKLRCKASSESLTPEVRKLLAENKQDIIAFLSTARKQNTALEPVPDEAPKENPAADSALRREPGSIAQQRMWILEQLRPDNSASHQFLSFEIRGFLCPKTLVKACDYVVTRHEALRTSFEKHDGKPRQVIHPTSLVSLALADFSGFSEAESREKIAALATRESRRHFALELPPLMRLVLLRFSPDAFTLFFTVHRMVADGVSGGIIVNEIGAAYGCLIKGTSLPSVPAPSQFSEYVASQNLWLQGADFRANLDWWKERLSGSIQVLELPTDRPRPKILTFQGATHHFSIGGDTQLALQRFCGSRSLSSRTVLLTTYKLLLYRMCQQRDILVGCNLLDRDGANHRGSVGHFLNWQVLRTRFEPDAHTPLVGDLLAEVDSLLEAAATHGNVPYEILLNELRLERDLSRNSLFQVTFSFNQDTHTLLQLEGSHSERVDLGGVVSEFDLSLIFHERGEGLQGTFVYNTNLFEEDTIARLATVYWTLLLQLIEDDRRGVLALDPLNEEQREEILVKWNQTERDFGVTKNLKTLFEQQVIKAPNNIALRFSGESWTYAELNIRANQLADYLIKAGLCGDQTVAVYMNRCMERVAGLIAVIKAGGAYVPLDPDYPIDGLSYMLQDCGANLLLSQRELHGTLPDHEARVLYLDPQWDLFETCSTKNPTVEPEPNQLAYIIYTSGPHARHKGVQTTHLAVNNRLHWLQTSFAMEDGDRFLQKTPFVYDISVWEIFWPLTSGATLVLARLGSHRNMGLLVRQVSKEQITHLHFVPSVLKAFLERDEVRICTALKKTFCSGEALPVQLKKQYFSQFPRATLHNLYGPPEVTIDATCWDYQNMEHRHTCPIGRPIANVRVYVVDRHFQPVPVGVEGELLIGGRGLSRGYRGRNRLTAKRFIPDPFGVTPGGRIFKTGDVVRFLSDGNLEFVGHLEHRRKVRGFRLDFGAIEAVFSGHPGIKQALVLTRNDTNGEACLVAYLIANDEEHPAEDELRTMLAKILPNYMVPAIFQFVPAFPRTPDGKVERRALPVPSRERPAEDEPYARAHSEIERKILLAWREVLELDQIDVHQNFFEIGGDSLKLVRVYRRLPDIMTEDLAVMDLFKHPTIHDLGLFFEAREEELAISSRAEDHKDQVDRLIKQVKKSKRVSIAIVGMAGRFPGANDINTFWDNIKNGRFSLTTFSSDQLLEAGIPAEQVEDANYVPIRGMVDGLRDFDAEFFDFTPREAQITDPQQRLFLEVAWEALETSGYVPQKYKQPIGIYGGVGYNVYFSDHIAPSKQIRERVGEMPIMIGNSVDNLCTRVAYKLNLTGPALSVQTACSTSLVAVHLGCQGLKNGDCEVALAGGVQLGRLGPIGYVYEEGMTFPPDGICRAFDARGKGSTVSQGVAVVVLKRLENAIHDGDRIWAVIKGTAINNDGTNKDGYTSYSQYGQETVIAAAQEQAGIDPGSISYMETSSTGSKLGDPIEVGAMTAAFRRKTAARQFCALGALKPNIGGLDVAAGCASLIKAALALYHRQLPPLIHFDRPSPNIDFANSPFYVNTRPRPWETKGHPRRAGVSAFGLGGTNAHVVLEEGPRFDPSPQSRSWQVVTLSAKTNTALETMTADFVSFLKNHPHENFSDMCYTLHVGRRDYKYRRVLVAQNLREATLDLENKDSEKVYTAIHKAGNRPVAFMFPGQGAQYLNMGRQLYREERIFRNEVERCWSFVQKHFPNVYRELSPKDLGGSTSKVDRTVVTQPLLFATQYALARLLMHWGIHPQAMIGNSLGEYVAAAIAGVFSLEDCIIAIVTRGMLMQEMPPGAQLAVQLPEARVRGLLNDKLSLAGIPNPNMCMVSGEKDAISKLKGELEAQNIVCYRLHASRAFHSFMMDPVVPKFTEKLSRLTLNPPKIPFISNVTGTWITPEEATSPNYWARHLRDTVRFSQGLEVLFETPNQILLEVGPEKILSGAAIKHPAKTRNHRVLATMRQPWEEESDLHHLLTTIGRLWLFGVAVDWENYHGDKKRFRMPLPTYPYERVRHWIDRAKLDYMDMAVLESDELKGDIEPADDHYRPNVSTEFVEPRNDDERFIASLWCEYLGLKEVGVHDDFFELGGSSLVAVRLVGILGKQFNVPLASHVLLKKRTIATLNDFIQQHTATADESDSPLVEIQRGHPRSIPLFLVHPVGGEVFFYRDMAQALGSEQAIYAFQALSLVGKMEPFSDIREQAAYYVKELIKFRPRSPFLLGGSSYGGCVAYEMALQLTARGYKVPLVVLVDSPAPGAVPEKLAGIAEILDYLLGDELNINIDELRDLEPEEQVAFVLEEARYANRMDLLPSSLGMPMFNTWMAHQEAMHNYKPQTYKGRVLFFRPTEQAKGNLMNMHLPWIDLVLGGIEMHQIPGNHLTMNEKPNVTVLARHLKRTLRRLTGG